MLDSNPNALPEPDEAAKKRSSLLLQSIQQACDAAGGRIRFSEFMNTALYEPGLGYYSGGLQKFGEKGDFITSPEVSPLFGQCLANQVAEVLQQYKQPSYHKAHNKKANNTKINNNATAIIEFGAGSGVLAADILLRLEALASLPEKYLILELSAELRERQKQAIAEKVPHLSECVHWLDQLPEDLNNAVVIANEVLDAMPVECFKIVQQESNGKIVSSVEALTVAVKDEQVVGEYVSASDSNSASVGDNANNSLAEKISAIQNRSGIDFFDEYCSEYNPAIKGWLAGLESKINNLVILLIDYGYNEKEYYHPDRLNGTLMCYYRHRAHEDYSWWPGLQDITAFVNFTDVAYSADELGLHVSGYSTQAAFLLANGLSELHASQVTDDLQQQIKLSQQIKTLTLPSEMGERFKVMALTKNYDEPLTGFSMLDLRNRL